MRVLTHGDCDGVCSAAVVKMVYPDAEVYFTNPSRLLRDLKRMETSDGVIVCDIALNEGEWPLVFEEIKRLSSGFEALYLDHHPLPMDFPKKFKLGLRFYHREEVSASEIAYTVFKERLDDSRREWAAIVATYGAVSDYTDDTPPASEVLKMIDRRVLYLESGLLTEALIFKRDSGFRKTVVEKLAGGVKPSQIPELPGYAMEALKLEYEVYEYVRRYTRRVGDIAVVTGLPYKGFLGKAAVYSAHVSDARVGCAVALKDNRADLSLRTRDPRIDLNKVVRSLAKALGGKGGGHTKACGVELPASKVEDFLHMLNSSLPRAPETL
ncbi:DHH family phosphoesterase [Candidatus Bathyarchaeota archaeon]|nr:DHH family phosphoesterase [Candidatus Bathyarchaeota archaeon]